MTPVARRTGRAQPTRRLARYRRDLLPVAALVAGTLLIEFLFRAAFARPLWYDELWRAHYLSVPFGQLWSEIRLANVPTAAGWLVLTRATADVFGWLPPVLRAPELVAMPLLAAAVYGLSRRFVGVVPAFLVAALVTWGGKALDLGMQVKPYAVEALCTVAIVALWMAPPLVGPRRRWVGRRLWAGVLTLFSVPAIFLLAPLAVTDVLATRGGVRARARALAGAAPALAICLVHTLLFLRRQSAQRGPDTFWNAYFAAGRGLGDTLAFVGRQLVLIAGSAPPGADRSDVNLVRTATEGSPLETWVLAPAFAVAFVLGAWVLLRRRDGRVLLSGLLGAELLILAASALRYWPFGATRTNAFLVPLLTLVPAVGLVELCRAARRHRALLVPALALTGVAALLVGSVATSTRSFYASRNRVRLSDGYARATDVVRREARPGDLVVVAAQLARAGWIYSTEVRGDRPPGQPALSRQDTVFVDRGGDGAAAAALHARPVAPRRVLLFVFAAERAAERPEVRELALSGWCPEHAQGLRNAGRLITLAPCPARNSA